MKTLIAFLMILVSSLGYSLTVPLRNIINIKGMQDNPVIGYGVVVGLKGTGDSIKNSQTKDILSKIALKFGYYLDYDKMQTKNSAIVMVTASIPPLTATGNRIDVQVSSIFDARSLSGGELVITPLMGGDGILYAVAQGTLDTGTDTKAVTGRISMGAIIQKDIPHEDLNGQSTITVLVHNNLGIESVQKVAEIIEQSYPKSIKNKWQNQLEITIPSGKDAYGFISELMDLSVDLIQEPKVLIDSRNGMVVSGGNVIISESAVSYKGTTVEITGNSGWSTGPGAKKEVYQMGNVTTVNDLVEGLNSLGANTKDIINILQMLYQNGNLKASLEVK